MSDRDPETESALDRALAELPAPDLEPGAAERVRRKAQRVLASEAALRDRPWMRAFDRLWSRRLEPALLAGSSAYYLIWALATVAVTRP